MGRWSVARRAVIATRCNCAARSALPTYTSRDGRDRITVERFGPIERGVGRHPRRAARPRPALDAAAPDPHRGPVADRRPRHRRASSSSAAAPSIPAPSPRPSTGRSTCSRSSASSATATARTAARSSTSCPTSEHGHLYCRRCGSPWELAVDDPDVVVAMGAVRDGRGFEIDVSHLTLIGRCAACRARDAQA